MIQTCIRATISNTTAFAHAIIEYATLDLTAEVRLAVTKRYVEGEPEPVGAANVYQNSPMLYAVAKVRLPSVPGDLFVVLDYPGLNMQRQPRESEVRFMLESLNKNAIGKVTYTTQPVEATNAMTPEQAARAIFAADYTDLDVSSEADLVARLK